MNRLAPTCSCSHGIYVTELGITIATGLPYSPSVTFMVPSGCCGMVGPGGRALFRHFKAILDEPADPGKGKTGPVPRLMSSAEDCCKMTKDSHR